MALVVESWRKVKAIPGYVDLAGELLFRRIFELNSDATAFFKFADGHETDEEAMYKTELFKKHATGVISTVTAAVDLLEGNKMEKLVKVLKELGASHSTMNLELAHYELVGQALIDTLAKALGEAFTDETKEAWLGVYGVITENMMAGAKEMAEKTPAEREKILSAKNAEKDEALEEKRITEELVTNAYRMTELSVQNMDPSSYVAMQNKIIAEQKRNWEKEHARIASDLTGVKL